MPLAPRDLAALRHAAFAPALIALPLALIGVLLVVVRARWLPELPRVAPLVPIALALGFVALGILRRIRHLLAARRRD
jgi:hypothetical protein